MPILFLLGACQSACQDSTGAGVSEEEFATLPPGATVEQVLTAVDGRPDKKEGIGTEGRGTPYFVILRDGERHGTAYRMGAYHVVIGSGVTIPEGTLVIRRAWATSGQIDGANEQPELYGISVAVEPGAQKPYSKAIVDAAGTFVEALSRRAPLHPDCVLAMGEVAFARQHAADAAERELAEAARARVPVPPPDGRIVIQKKDGTTIPVAVERRRTTEGIAVGMMFRKRFDGENRGMLFEYPNPDWRHFWMKNCPIPIDVAYINRGRIEEIRHMTPGYGIDQRELRHYESHAVANFALEMPKGWFDEHGVKPGDTLTVAG